MLCKHGARYICWRPDHPRCGLLLTLDHMSSMGARRIFSRGGQVRGLGMKVPRQAVWMEPEWSGGGVWKQSPQKLTTGCENNAHVDRSAVTNNVQKHFTTFQEGNKCPLLPMPAGAHVCPHQNAHWRELFLFRYLASRNYWTLRFQRYNLVNLWFIYTKLSGLRQETMQCELPAELFTTYNACNV